jgi:hypothetical protein
MNFPGRKNRRRQEALDRIKKKTLERVNIQKAVDSLKAKIIDQAEAENTKTKIKREKRK